MLSSTAIRASNKEAYNLKDNIIINSCQSKKKKRPS